jgi:hypothetical protein
VDRTPEVPFAPGAQLPNPGGRTSLLLGVILGTPRTCRGLDDFRLLEAAQLSLGGLNDEPAPLPFSDLRVDRGHHPRGDDNVRAFRLGIRHGTGFFRPT